jgi:SCA7-like zinc-binding protein
LLILELGPVDVERQCGVLLPNGMPCARSLTCKSHSMGAKRAVAGRSLPYDMLLAAYQKKNQAKQQSKPPLDPKLFTSTANPLTPLARGCARCQCAA